MKFTRRKILKNTAIAPLIYPLALQTSRAQDTGSEPHFFIHIMFESGWDPFYLFDSCSREIYNAGKGQNYFSRTDHAVPWTDQRGGGALVSHLVDTYLGEFKQQFSIVNGMIMSTSFDGHNQNENFFLTGSAFGGSYFLPLFNSQQEMPLDFIQVGRSEATIFNDSNKLPIDKSSIKGIAKLASKLQASKNLTLAEKIMFARMQGVSELSTTGLLSMASRKLTSAYEGSFELAKRIRNVNLNEQEGQEDETIESIDFAIKTVCEMFKSNVAKGAFIAQTIDFDTHGVGEAQEQQSQYEKAAKLLQHLLKLMNSIPYDDQQGSGKSMLDVTTLLISSEFGRTMRQKNKPITATGTDHNPLSNSAVIAGKGIQGGLIVGSSDLKNVDADGNFTEVSRFHQHLDADLLKTMGRPFDFQTGLSYSNLEGDFTLSQYLNVSNLVNTVLKLLNVPESHYRKVGTQNGSPVAPVISALLK